MNKSSKYSLDSSFSLFIEQVFNEKYMFDLQVKHICRKASLSHFYNHLFFITVHFKPDICKIANEKSPVQTKAIFDAYRKWHLTVSKKLLGPKFNKKPLLQPFSMAFLDVEGSRYKMAPKVFQIPHIHALLLVHPDTQAEFENLRKRGVLKEANDSRITGIDIIKFEPQLGSVTPLMTYASKYPCQTLREARIDKTFWSYPDLDATSYPFYGGDWLLNR